MTERKNYLDHIVREQKRNQTIGIPSICSANLQVVDAILRYAKLKGAKVLIESTCNQVNQYGGYTNMIPSVFVSTLKAKAKEIAYPECDLIIGGDHLGPNVWKNENSDSAMEKSRILVRDYVRAGYQKIHIDTSMKCLDDRKEHPLDPKIIAERTADLISIAESTHAEKGERTNSLRYVIGTEVPTPGGIQDEDETSKPTNIDDVAETLELTKKAFNKKNLNEAWERVIAVVVQPGVEFGDNTIIEYNPASAKDLKSFIEKEKNLVYEAHSTDYQTRSSLQHLVKDHFAILKVGPALTFAYREAIFSLHMIEQELCKVDKNLRDSDVINVIEKEMLEFPEYWKKYYHGTEEKIAFSRQYSLSDRIRYYLPFENVQKALKVIIDNLRKVDIPYSLLSQFLPNQYWEIRSGRLLNDPVEILRHSIITVYRDYINACTDDTSS